MTPTFDFHHFGVACRRIDDEVTSLAILGYRPEGEEFVDPLQGVRGRFVVGGGPRLELLVGLPGSSTLNVWLERGTRIYHQAFEVDDIAEAAGTLVASGGRLVVAPVPATAFAGRRICFVMLRTMDLVELIEKGS